MLRHKRFRLPLSRHILHLIRLIRLDQLITNQQNAETQTLKSPWDSPYRIDASVRLDDGAVNSESLISWGLWRGTCCCIRRKQETKTSTKQKLSEQRQDMIPRRAYQRRRKRNFRDRIHEFFWHLHAHQLHIQTNSQDPEQKRW